MNDYLLLLRFFHIVSSVIWTGGAIVFAIFISPTVKATGPDGGKFMQQLVQITRYPMIMNIIAIISLLSGVLLMWTFSGGVNQNGWMGTSYGIMMSTGGTFAIVAYITGLILNLPASKALQKLWKEITDGGGPPNSDQQQRIAIHQTKLILGTNIIAFLLLICVIFMAIARYL